MDNLTDKQRMFVEAYLQCWNASKAARIAGYSAKTAGSMGHDLLKKPEIQGAIQQRIREAAMTTDEALARLSAHATGDVTEFLGLSTAQLKKHPRSHLIKRYKRRTTTTRDGDKEETVEIELYDAQAALVHLLKEQHLASGEATERSENVIVQLTDEERAERIAQLLDRGRARRAGPAADRE